MTDPDLPDALALVAEARHTLLEHVLPALSGNARIKALMVANAPGIAARELEAPAPIETPVDLVTAIRAGLHDADPDVFAQVMAAATPRVMVARPAALRQDRPDMRHDGRSVDHTVATCQSRPHRPLRPYNEPALAWPMSKEKFDPYIFSFQSPITSI